MRFIFIARSFLVLILVAPGLYFFLFKLIQSNNLGFGNFFDKSTDGCEKRFDDVSKLLMSFSLGNNSKWKLLTNYFCDIPDPLEHSVCSQLLPRSDTNAMCRSSPFSEVTNAGILRVHFELFSSLLNPTPCFYQCFRHSNGDDQPLAFSSRIYLTTSAINVSHCNFVYVSCHSLHTQWQPTYQTVHTYFSGVRTVLSKVVQSAASGDHLSILILGFDNVPLNSFVRSMPLTLPFLVRELGAKVLKGYNIIEPFSFANLGPILSGRNHTDLRSINNGSSYVDLDWPLLWSNFSRKGFTTVYSEDTYYSTFNHQQKGFGEKPTDYYLYPFWRVVEHIMSSRMCLPHRSQFSVFLSIVKNVVTVLHNKPYFAFLHFNGLTHNGADMIAHGDHQIYTSLRFLTDSGALNKTLLIFMSDHGDRYVNMENHRAGSQELRLPGMFLVFPKWFRTKYNHLISALDHNQHVLTSPFDIHKTLLDLLNFDHLENKQYSHDMDVPSKPGLSLFGHIPHNRTCAHAHVTSCACDIKPAVEVSIDAYRNYAVSVVAHLNVLVESIDPGKCQDLSLSKLVRASIRRTDGLNTTADSECEVVNLVFETSPSGGQFEVDVRKCRNILANIGTVNRVNRYGDQSRCVHDRKIVHICYCKWLPWLSAMTK